ncbi:MAG: hypothetical protein WCE68_16200 [Anaerolineales bacterium]
MQNYRNIIVVSLALLLLLACNISSLSTTTVTKSAPTGVGELQTSAPSPSPTPLTPTVTAAPAGLNGNGPFILFKGQDGIWITNPDGSFPTRVSEFGIQGDLRPAISPAGDRMALVVENDQGLDLVMVQIPSGAIETIDHLISVTTADLSANPTTPKAFATYAIRDNPDVAWQPGAGRYLAFTGAIDGPTSDLYVYDTQTHATKQLTSGPSQAITPIWSPDGQYILSFGVSWVPPFGGAILPDRLDGIWAVRVSDGKIIPLPSPKNTSQSISPNFVGWQDASHYISYDTDDQCASINLHTVDVASGETKSLMATSFYDYIARSPENGGLLFSSAAGCPSSLGDGTFLLLPGQTTPVKVLDKQTWEIDWLPESKVFYAYPEALVSSDGNTRYDPPVYSASYLPAVSKAGYQAWEVLQNQQGSVAVRIPGGDWQTILKGSVTQLIWDPAEGKTLLISLQDGSLYAASYPLFTPRLMGSVGSKIDQAIWVP